MDSDQANFYTLVFMIQFASIILIHAITYIASIYHLCIPERFPDEFLDHISSFILNKKLILFNSHYAPINKHLYYSITTAFSRENR